MKQNRILVMAVLAVDLILAVVCMAAYFGEDRVRPEFRFQTDDYIYELGDGESKLLENIMAYDDRDGNISERIVIEKIMENRESSTVVVYYAVSDSAGNVAKISRVFVADFGERNYSEGEGTEAPGEAPADTALMTEKDSGTGNRSEETGDGGAAGAESGISGEAGDSGNDGEAAEEGREENPESTAENEEENENEEPEDNGQAASAAEPVMPEPQENRSGYPVLTLRAQEVTIEAGTSPPWTEIIETLRDDKDDYATLYYNLSVSRFNRNQPGDYPVSLYTEDSDGNRSDTVTVTVHVRG